MPKSHQTARHNFDFSQQTPTLAALQHNKSTFAWTATTASQAHLKNCKIISWKRGCCSTDGQRCWLWTAI